MDLTTCEREPIHIPSAIQPHGVLLACDRSSRRVVTASANAAPFFGRALDDVLDASLVELLGPALSDRIVEADTLDNLDEALEAHLVLPSGAGGFLSEVRADVVLHLCGQRLVVEIEPVPPHTTPVSHRATRGAIARLAATVGIDDLCARLTREVRALTGFDRVMVYRFDANWNGEVIAEDRRGDLDSLMGLHYPASDIPAQARRLYTLNWMRLIADVDYIPAPLHPTLDPSTGAPLDMSHSVLRSVSPIHLEYLRNMGVGASMSISLIVEGRLWGLVACHHYSGAHHPGYDARSAAEFLAQTASPLLGERMRSHERDQALAAQELVTGILTTVSASTREPLVSLVEDLRLLQLMGADGVAAWTGHELLTQGVVPTSAQCRRIATLLARSDGAPTFVDHLGALDPQLNDIADDAAGALRVGIDDTGWILWLRAEQPRALTWAGDPDNAKIVHTEDLQVRISPRQSFAKWREVVRGRCRPWQPWHASTADRLRTHLTGIMLGRSRGQIALAESLQRAVVLDEAPQLPGLDLLARYRPAEGSQLGGDWWDVLPLEQDRVAIVVGDVAGHGVHAAAAMAQLRTAVRAYLLEGHSPASALDRLDAMVCSLLGEHTATALIAIMTYTQGAEVTSGADSFVTVEVASAGHPPPLVATAEGTTVMPVRLRPMLGLGSELTTGLPEEDLRLRLPRDAVLCLYTDGLVERREADLDQTTAVLAHAAYQTLRTKQPTTVNDLALMADQLLAAVPGDAGDDTTLVLVQAQRS